MRDVIGYVCSEKGILEIPKICPPMIQDMLNFCWYFDPDKRPNFCHLRTIIEEVKTDHSLLQEKNNLVPAHSDQCYTNQQPLDSYITLEAILVKYDAIHLKRVKTIFNYKSFLNV